MNAISARRWSVQVPDAELAGIVRGHRARHGTILAARICGCPRCAEVRERELARARERKLSYRGTCERCGAPTDGGNGRAQAPKACTACAHKFAHERRRWTPEAIVEAIHRFAREHGRQPTSTEWLSGDRGPDYPSVLTVQREFGSWAAAVEAAGFPRPWSGVRVVTKTLVCVRCGQEFTHTRRSVRYCPEHRRPRWPTRTRPLERECSDCGASFVVSGRGQGKRTRCYDCSARAPKRRWPETARDAICVKCGESFTTLPTKGQGSRRHCYVCMPFGQSPWTLWRARRRARETPAAEGSTT